MSVSTYLFHHKYFKSTIVLIYLLLIVLKVANPDSLSFLIYVSGILGYLLFPILMYIWLSVYVQFFELPICRYRISGRYEEKTYFVKSFIFYTFIYSFLIGAMMFCLSGFWTDTSLIPVCFRNLVLYVVMYCLFSSIYIIVYFNKKKVNLAIMITVLCSLSYGVYMFKSGNFIEILINNTAFIKLILIAIVGIVVLMLLATKRSSVFKMLNYKYLAFSLILILQIQGNTDIDFNSYLTYNLINNSGLDSYTLYTYFIWLIPKLIIIMDCIIMFSKYLSENFNYFLIRSNQIGWIKLIWYRIIKMTLIYSMIQLIIYIVFTQTIMKYDDMLLLIMNFLWIIMAVSILILTRLISSTDKSSNWMILIYLGICLFIIKIHPSDTWFNIFMMQNVQTNILIVTVIGIVVLTLISVKILKNTKN